MLTQTPSDSIVWLVEPVYNYLLHQVLIDEDGMFIVDCVVMGLYSSQ